MTTYKTPTKVTPAHPSEPNRYKSSGNNKNNTKSHIPIQTIHKRIIL